MKSSGPVFTRQNPFQPTSRGGKTYYHPSRNQSLSNKKKQTTLSPVRSNQRSSPQLHPVSQQLFEKGDHGVAATDGQPVFAESWPSTDCGSSPASTITSSDMETPKQSARAGKNTSSSELGVQQDSVLAKYIERFRHGRPQSREERQQMASAIGGKQLPFWWTSPSPLPSSLTPTKRADKDDREPATFGPAGQSRLDGSLSPCRGSLSILSDTYQGELDDTEILQLQERANRLLLRDECALGDGSIHVSSEGLGCSDFSSPLSVDEPVRRPLIPSAIKSTTALVIPPVVPPARPEEDILFQWRLRRKIEQAREWPQSLQHSSLRRPTFSLQGPGLCHASTSGQDHMFGIIQSIPPPESSQKAAHPLVTGPQPGSCPPSSGPPPFPARAVSGSSLSQPQTVARVPAHMHLLCDMLPCPIQSSHASTQQNISQGTDESGAKVGRKKTQSPGSWRNTFTDGPICEHVPSASSGALAGEPPSRHKISERNNKEKGQSEESEKKTAISSSRKQKKSPRHTEDRERADDPGSANKCTSHQRLPKKLPLRTEQQQQQQQQEGRREFSSESRTGHHAPPCPVRSALGQVVSEVLFPAMDPASPASPPRASAVPPRSSAPPCDAQNSAEVISQLLQEAEDSDEKEFEDDPLLQVLRKQRKWVKEQISEVDSMLDEFLDEKHDT